jgi:hypothetical protein
VDDGRRVLPLQLLSEGVWVYMYAGGQGMSVRVRDGFLCASLFCKIALPSH